MKIYLILLIRLDVPINSPHKDIRSEETNCSTEQKKGKAEQRGVSEIEGRLNHSGHVCLELEVIHGVQEHVQGSRSCGEKAVPYPTPILGIQQHVSGYDGGT